MSTASDGQQRTGIVDEVHQQQPGSQEALLCMSVLGLDMEHRGSDTLLSRVRPLNTDQSALSLTEATFMPIDLLIAT